MIESPRGLINIGCTSLVARSGAGGRGSSALIPNEKNSNDMARSLPALTSDASDGVALRCTGSLSSSLNVTVDAPLGSKDAARAGICTQRNTSHKVRLRSHLNINVWKFQAFRCNTSNVSVLDCGHNVVQRNRAFDHTHDPCQSKRCALASPLAPTLVLSLVPVDVLR